MPEKEPWQLRVEEEERELSQKLTRLDEFIVARKAPTDEDERLLIEQSAVMRAYLAVLHRRIDRW